MSSNSNKTSTNLGTDSLNNSSGNWNTAIGAYTLSKKNTGVNNVAVVGSNSC